MSATNFPAQKRSNLAQVVAGVLISLVFLWLAFRGVDWRAAWETIAHASVGLLLAGLASVWFTTLIRAERWRWMFYPDQRRLRLSRFLAIFLIGQVINAVVPARIGEIARAYLVGEREGVSKAHALWSTVVEKVLDALCLLVFLAGLSLIVPLPAWLQRSGWTLTLGIIGLFAALGVALAMHARFTAWLEAWSARRRWAQRLRLVQIWRVIAASLALIRQPRLCGALAFWSAAAFLAGAATNWLVARAMGLELSFTACLLLLAVLQISAVAPIPTSPGRIGLFHYLCIISLAVFDVPREIALSYGLVLHAIVYLPMIVGGPLCLALESHDWRGLMRLLDETPQKGYTSNEHN